MATARPTVSVYQFDNPSQRTGSVAMPVVLAAPLRPDLVQEVHRDMSKNRRQPHAVKDKAGYGTAAESWGTGRAVARIPRVPGGGTHRAGQGAFGNMCRGGGMFAPLKIWRRWHRKINVTKKRHAVVSALAAASLTPLVMARGHRIGKVAELPLVVSNGLESLQKTKQACETLKKLGFAEELERIKNSKKIRAGKGKARNRRYVMRKGPLVIYNEDNGIVRAFRNLPGIQTQHVSRLNLLTLAPGGHMGRMLIWTEGAFKKLNQIYGKGKDVCPGKKGYNLPRAVLDNADVARIINSAEVQSVLRPKLEGPKKLAPKRNPLVNKKAMAQLNPCFLKLHEARRNSQIKGTKEHELVQKRKAERKQAVKEDKKKFKGENSYHKLIMKAFAAKAAESQKKQKPEEEEAGDDE